MKLTFVVHQFLPHYFTGTEQYVYAIARAMQRLGHDVEVFSLEPNFAEIDPLFSVQHSVVEGIPVVRVQYWYCLDRDHERLEYTNPYLGVRFAQHLRERGTELVHVFHLRYVGAEVIAESKRLGIPTVVHLMDFWFLCPLVVLRRTDGRLCSGPPDGGIGCVDCVRPELAAQLRERDVQPEVERAVVHFPASASSKTSPPSRVHTLVHRPSYLRTRLLEADRVFAPSRFLKSMFVQNGYPAERIEVMGYGIDDQRLAGYVRPPRSPGAPLRCAFFGTLADHKGADLAIDAVLSSDAHLQLAIHGRTSDYPSYSKPLVERAAKDPRIRFVGPFAREQLGAVLSSTDVLLVPSRWYENTPFVVLEAFAASVPVIATDLGGLSELVRDEENGELFAVDDVADLRRRLERLAREPERLLRYQNALPPVKRMDQNGTELDAVYRELAAASAKNHNRSLS